MSATHANDLLDPAALARIENYELMARVAVEGFLSGLHRSVFHGFGTEFLQYRNYSPGEDLKFVDWKVFGRSERLYTKVFQEETNMDVHLLVDLSQSMDYKGSRAAVSKDKYTRMLAACFAYMGIRQGDNVSLVIYNDRLREVIPPSRRSGQLARLLQALHREKCAGSADHELAVRYLERNLRSRGLVIVLSDMLECEDSLPRMLKRLHTAHTDCIALQVLDGDELDLPRAQATRFVDAESGAERVTSPENVADAYNRQMDAYVSDLAKRCRSAGADFQTLDTRTSLGESLARYLDHHRSAR